MSTPGQPYRRLPAEELARRYALVKRLRTEGRSLAEIGRLVGCDYRYVSQMEKKLGFPSRIMRNGRRKLSIEPEPQVVSEQIHYEKYAPTVGIEAVVRILVRPSITSSSMVDVPVSLPRVKFLEC